MIVDRIGQPLVTSTKRRQFSDALPSVVDIVGTEIAAPTNASAHSKGAWVELIASTSDYADLLQIICGSTFNSGNYGAALMDVGVGAASSEVVVAANIPVGNHASSQQTPSFPLPLRISKGSRIAVRWQSFRAGAADAKVTCVLQRWPTSLGIFSPTILDTIGATTGTTSGVSMGTTSGAWVQMSASAPQAYQGFCVDLISSDNTMSNGTGLTVDVGVGGSGSEQGVSSATLFTTSSIETFNAHSNTGVLSGFVPIACPKGARIAARVNDPGIANSTPEAIIVGVPYG